MNLKSVTCNFQVVKTEKFMFAIFAFSFLVLFYRNVFLVFFFEPIFLFLMQTIYGTVETEEAISHARARETG